MTRRAVAVLVHGAAAVLLVVGLVAQVVRPLAPELGSLPDPTRWFDAAYLARARAYRYPLYAAGVVALVAGVAIPCLVALTAPGRGLVERIVQKVGAGRPARAAATVMVAVVALTDLVLLPVSFWAGFVHEGAYGFRTQGLAGWTRDWVVAAGLSWAAVGALALAGWTLVRRLPRWWAPVAGLGAAALTATLTLAAPLVLEPLFFDTRPLEPGPVRAEVEQVLTRADARVDQILVADASRRTTKQNAYVSGLGATRRVVLYDTLLSGRTPDEVALVIAHELGHVRHADVARAVLLAGAGAVVLAYGLAVLVRWRAATGRQDGEADPRAAAVVVAVVVLASVLVMPLERAVSRRAEAAADLAALNLTADPATFIAMNAGLARANLADPIPPPFVKALWMTHPSALARLAMGERWPLQS